MRRQWQLRYAVANGLAASTQWRVVRRIHCLVGDGICTHAAAARLLWSWAAAAPVAPNYRLLVFTCSTHAANLVVRTAICDDARHADSHPLVATCVRFFKYLMPGVRGRVCGPLARACGGPAPGALVPHLSRPLSRSVLGYKSELYGKRVIPDSLCSLVSGAPGALEHWVGAVGRSSGSQRQQAPSG